MIEHLRIILFQKWHPNMAHCCEALSNYFCTTQVVRGTFWEIWRIEIQIYPKTFTEPKYGIFYLKNKVRVRLQSLLVQLSSRVAPPYKNFNVRTLDLIFLYVLFLCFSICQRHIAKHSFFWITLYYPNTFLDS